MTKRLAGTMIGGAALLICLAASPAQAQSPSPGPGASNPAPPSTTSAPPTSASTLQLPPPTYGETSLKVDPISAMKPDSCGTAAKPAEPADSWQLSRLNMEQAWRIATGKGIRVAVIDTGMDFDDSMHAPAARFSAYNVLPPPEGQNANAPYQCDHGTAVASLLGAQQHGNTINFSGIAPDAEIIGIRALAGQGFQEIDGTVAAVRAATEMKVDIINISQTTDVNRGEYADAIQAALDAGIVVVAAAGNTSTMGDAPIAYPAAYPGVIAVGMTNQADVADPESFAMPGLVSVAAPGTNLTALAPTESGPQQFTVLSKGTSYAAPIVSGVVALMLEQAANEGTTLTPEQVRTRLELTADRPPGPIPDPRLGHGIVNPVRALSRIDPPSAGPQPTSASQSPTSTGTPPVISPWPKRIAIGAAGLAGATVVIGLSLRAALPAARERGGRPAAPSER